VKLRHLVIITWMELKKIWNDRRRLSLFVIGPILLSLATGFIASKSPTEIDVTVIEDVFDQSSAFASEQALQLINIIDSSDSFSVTTGYSREEAFKSLAGKETRAVIIISEKDNGIDSIHVTIDVTDPSIQDAVYADLKKIFEEYATAISSTFLNEQGLPIEQADAAVEPLEFNMSTNWLQEGKFIDNYASALIIMFAMSIALLASVTSITTERVNGTMERIFVSPFRRSEIIIGKMIANSILAVVVAIAITVTLKLVFDVMLGNIFLVLLLIILVGINAVNFGLLISSVTYTELESIFMGVVCMFLFMILMGFMWPFETMHPVFTYLSRFTPYIYSVEAIRYVNLAGWGFSEAMPDILMLCAFIVVQAFISMVLLRREVK
jgi:ABC-2 type transport system permease protein